MKVMYISNVTFNARLQLNTKHKYANSSTIYHVFPTHATETLTFSKKRHEGYTWSRLLPFKGLGSRFGNLK